MMPVAIAGALGAMTWSLAEHIIHQNLGHRFAHNRNFFAQEHVRHHATTSYFAPTTKKLAAAVATSAVVWPLAAAAAGPTLGTAFTLGLMGAYGGYEVVHRIAHTHPPRTRYGRWLRRHHFHHHFHNPAVNHGVTSALWDHLFGTYERPGIIRVPVKHAMPWLLDPETGKVRRQHAADYQLRSATRAPAEARRSRAVGAPSAATERTST
jgi:hypothetical protein